MRYDKDVALAELTALAEGTVELVYEYFMRCNKCGSTKWYNPATMRDFPTCDHDHCKKYGFMTYYPNNVNPETRMVILEK